MNATETLQVIDRQIENLKKHKDIDVPTKLIDLQEVPEQNFELFKAKIVSKNYNVFVNNQGDMYKVFNYVAPKGQKLIKDVIQYTPYIFAILTAIYGVLDEHYILATSLLIPFISGFVTGFLKPNIITIIILGGLTYLFIYRHNIVGFLFMCNWTVSILLTGLIRVYIKSVLIKISLLDEKIFSFLYYSRLIQVYDLKNQELIYSK